MSFNSVTNEIAICINYNLIRTPITHPIKSCALLYLPPGCPIFAPITVIIPLYFQHPAVGKILHAYHSVEVNGRSTVHRLKKCWKLMEKSTKNSLKMSHKIYVKLNRQFPTYFLVKILFSITIPIFLKNAFSKILYMFRYIDKNIMRK